MSSHRCLNKMMPKPVATRWGTSNDSEEFGLQLPEHFPAILEGALIPKEKNDGKDGKGKKRRRGKGRGRAGKGRGNKSKDNVAAADGVANLDETGIQQTEWFQERKKRWANETFAQIKLPSFWVYMAISKTTRSPWHHFYAFLQADLSASRDKYRDEETHLSVLVNGKHQDITLEFDKLLQELNWLDSLIAKNAVDPEVLLATVVTLTLTNHGCFQLRVVDELESFQKAHILLRLCHDEHPDGRLELANRLIEMRDSDGGKSLCPTLRKFTDFQRNELLRLIEADGYCEDANSFMNSSPREFRQAQDIDAQDVERANKIVTRETDLAPGESSALLAARTTIKLSVTNAKATRTKQETLDAIVATSRACQTHFATTEYKELFADANRFLKPGGKMHLLPIHDFNAAPAAAPLQDGDACDAGLLAPEAPDMGVAPPIAAEGPLVAVVAAGLAPPAPPGPGAAVPVAPDRRPDVFDDDVLQEAWAKAWNLQWSRATAKGSLKLTALFGIRVLNESIGERRERIFVACSKLWYEGRFHELVEAADLADSWELRFPLNAFSSVEFFKATHSHAAPDPVRLSTVPLKWRIAGSGEHRKLVTHFNIDEEVSLFDVWQDVEKTIEFCGASAFHEGAGAEGAEGCESEGGGAGAAAADTAGAADALRGPEPAAKKRASKKGQNQGHGAKARKLTPMEILKKFAKRMSALLYFGKNNVETKLQLKMYRGPG